MWISEKNRHRDLEDVIVILRPPECINLPIVHMAGGRHINITKPNNTLF